MRLYNSALCTPVGSPKDGHNWSPPKRYIPPQTEDSLMPEWFSKRVSILKARMTTPSTRPSHDDPIAKPSNAALQPRHLFHPITGKYDGEDGDGDCDDGVPEGVAASQSTSRSAEQGDLAASPSSSSTISTRSDVIADMRHADEAIISVDPHGSKHTPPKQIRDTDHGHDYGRCRPARTKQMPLKRKQAYIGDALPQTNSNVDGGASGYHPAAPRPQTTPNDDVAQESMDQDTDDNPFHVIAKYRNNLAGRHKSIRPNKPDESRGKRDHSHSSPPKSNARRLKKKMQLAPTMHVKKLSNAWQNFSGEIDRPFRGFANRLSTRNPRSSFTPVEKAKTSPKASPEIVSPRPVVIPVAGLQESPWHQGRNYPIKTQQLRGAPQRKHGHDGSSSATFDLYAQMIVQGQPFDHVEKSMLDGGVDEGIVRLVRTAWDCGNEVNMI